MITQKRFDELEPGDVFWGDSNQEWSTFEGREMTAGPVWLCKFKESASRTMYFPEDKVFVQIREEYYVAMTEYGETTGLCGPFLSEIMAEEYICNINNTFEQGDETYSWVKLIDPDQFLKDMEDL